MRLIRALLLTLAIASAAAAQTPPPGTITVSTTVTATAGAGAAAVQCVLSTSRPPAIHAVCTIGGTVVISQDATAPVGAVSGNSETVIWMGNSVTWIVAQPTAGSVTWQISANGTMQSGTF
jgi:hypothetical protein